MAAIKHLLDLTSRVLSLASAMAATFSPSSTPFIFLSFLLAISAGAALAQVPASATFKYVNEGEFGEFLTEYGGWYRRTPLFGSPFQLMWYNTTPGQFYLGLRMGLRRSESLFRWVWDANRGSPVGEGATLTFGTDGNLVLAEANGRVAWSTGTANKGVVGIKIIPGIGNIVLYDKEGKFMWQSFDHPVDTLLPGQALRLGGRSTLVSRKSDSDNSDGTYTLTAEPKGFTMYMAASPKPLPYFHFSYADSVKSIAFAVTRDETLQTYYLTLMFTYVAQMESGSTEVRKSPFPLTRLKFNATLSFLRLRSDGNLVAYTYYEPLDNEAWEKTFDAFSEKGFQDNGEPMVCGLPTKCGALGVCEDGACVACPTPKGLLGWSKSCGPPKRPPGACKPGGRDAKYFKVSGVEHFVTHSTAGEGRMKVADCMNRCSLDCNCQGFYYWQKESRCWLSPVLGTLSRSSNTTHYAYIKYY